MSMVPRRLLRNQREIKKIHEEIKVISLSEMLCLKARTVNNPSLKDHSFNLKNIFWCAPFCYPYFLSFHKWTRIGYMNWPGVDLINVLRTAFTHVDPECAKKRVSQQYHLALLGPTSVKAARKTLVKLTPGFDSTTFQSRVGWDEIQTYDLFDRGSSLLDQTFVLNSKNLPWLTYNANSCLRSMRKLDQ